MAFFLPFALCAHSNAYGQGREQKLYHESMSPTWGM
jgi:hypothetical protein